MDTIERLVPTNVLKTTFLSNLSTRKASLFFNYDDEMDVLMLLVASPETETIVHFVDEHVALLYMPESLDIVGLQIDEFESSFVPMYESLQKVWRLSDTDVPKGNVWDLKLIVEEQELTVALEVVKATEPVLGPPAEELARVLQYA